MLVENITCISVKEDGDFLHITLANTDFLYIEQQLVGKKILSVYTDNTEQAELVEKYYDYSKADSCKYDYATDTYTLTLRKLTQLEKEVDELKAAMAKLLETSPSAE